jgi:hypothetical protein
MNVSKPVNVNTACQCQHYSATATKAYQSSQDRSFADLLALYSIKSANGNAMDARLPASSPDPYLHSPSLLSRGLSQSADLLSSLLLYSAFSGSGSSLTGTPLLSGTSPLSATTLLSGTPLLYGSSMYSGLLRNPVLSQYNALY